MANVTLEVLRRNGPGNPTGEVDKWKKGDIVTIFPTSKRNWVDFGFNPLSSPFVYVHITGVPATNLTRKLKRRFEQDWYTYELGELTPEGLPGAPGEPDEDFDSLPGHINPLIRRRKWGALLDAVPLSVKQLLAAEGRATFQWSAVKVLLYNFKENRPAQNSDLSDD